MKLTLDDIDELPIIYSGQFADLKIDTGTFRIWRSRCTILDGETQPIQAEKLVNGKWIDITLDFNQYGSIKTIEFWFPLYQMYVTLDFLTRRFIDSKR